MGHIYLTPSQLTSGGLITAILRSRSLKVTDFCTNRKPICDFLLAINKKRTSHLASFPWFCILLVKFSLSTGGTCLQHTRSEWTHNYSWPRCLALSKLERALYRMVLILLQTFISFCRNARVCQTDGQTDRQTKSRQTELAFNIVTPSILFIELSMLYLAKLVALLQKK